MADAFEKRPGPHKEDMIEIIDDKDSYLAQFSRLEKVLRVRAKEKPWLLRLREAAMERFAELGFPTASDEEWRFTPLAALRETTFQLPERVRHDLTVSDIDAETFADNSSCRLVFVNGYFAKELSSVAAGLTVGNLRDFAQAEPEKVEPYLAQHADYQEHPFVALNTAFFQDGAFVLIPKGIVLDKSIHLVFASVGNGQPTVSHPRTLIVAGGNSRATVVESYLGLDESVYFTNAVTEIVLSDNAAIDHYKVQRESPAAFHIATKQIHQARGSRFSSHAITFGGSLTRNEVNVVLDAEGCECTLNGLYTGYGRQLIDNHTRIDHAKPHCASHELYKGILDDQARGVFNGKIYVHPDAQKTDAKQTNKTLLLSDDAVIDTKPQLEIFADDVKCTHGATIGQLDEEALFYLRSRGIGLEEARKLLVYAFANDIVGRIQVEPLRQRLEQVLLHARDGKEAL